MSGIPKRSEAMKGVTIESDEPKLESDKVMGMMINHLQQLDAEVSFLTGEIARMKRENSMFRDAVANAVEEIKRAKSTAGTTADSE